MHILYICIILHDVPAIQKHKFVNWSAALSDARSDSAARTRPGSHLPLLLCSPTTKEYKVQTFLLDQRGEPKKKQSYPVGLERL